VREALADWSTLPKDIYVIGAQRVDAVGFDVQCCSVPMITVPEVRYVRADMIAALSTPSDAVNESAEARLREALEHYAKEYCEGWCEQDAGCANFDHDCGGCLARRALSAVGDEAKKSEGGLAPGCCSAVSPCAYQKRDPTTICDTCKAAQTSGVPSDPPDRREIVARTIKQVLFGGSPTDEPSPHCYKVADAILSALGGEI
jgi:hypothetical protein